MKRFVRTLLCAAMLSASVATTAVAERMDFNGQWRATSTYERGKVVIYNKGIYYSLKSSRSAPNRAKIPGTNGSIGWREQVGTVGNTLHSGIGPLPPPPETWATSISTRRATVSSAPRMSSRVGRRKA